MTESVLPLLPSRGLDQSILLAVLVGLWILAFFVETYGWVFVGLVVPGYLASVIVVNPAAGAALTFEAVLTFLIVRWLSDALSRTRAWSPFFGRERFFAIVLVSVIVRQVSEIWLLDVIGGWIDRNLGTELVASRELASIGLVLVPLIANMFWKLNVRRGLVQVGVPTLLTYALLQLLLLPHTNLSFSALELTYENVALDFLGSAKAYIMLITGAFLAARANLRYGWDFNGILIPSLLSLVWLSPLAIAVTLIEALILFYTARLVMRLPGLRTANLEGPRKILLVFTVGFLIKYAAGWLLGDRLPSLAITELFGFGYVLTSLLAVKMLQKQAVGRVLLPTLQVSLTAFLIGNAVGYGLEQVSPSHRGVASPGERLERTPPLLRRPQGVAAAAAMRARPDLPPELRAGRSGAQLSRYARLWQGIDRWVDHPEGAGDATKRRLTSLAAELGLHLRPMEEGIGTRRAYSLVEREERLRAQEGWDTAFFFPGAPGPYLVVPRAIGEPLAADSAALLCERLECRGVLISGVDRRDGGRSAADPVASSRATLQVALRQLRTREIVAVRASRDAPQGSPRLHLRHTLPPSIDLAALWPLGPVELDWSTPPDALATARPGILSFRVHPADLRRLTDAATGPPPDVVSGVPLEAWLADRVVAGSVRFVPPTETELRYLSTRLATAVLAGRRPPATIERMASLVGFELVRLRDCRGPGQGCRILAPRREETAIAAGALVVLEGDDRGSPLALEVPRPVGEHGTMLLAAALWRETAAGVLAVDLTECARPSGATGPLVDPVEIGAVDSGFQALHIALHRSLAGRRGAAILQIRGAAEDVDLGAGAVVSVGAPLLQERQKPAAVSELLEPEGVLARIAGSCRWADGSRALSSITGQGNPQVAYSRAIGEVDTVLVWLPPAVRARYQPTDELAIERALAFADLPSVPGGDLRAWLDGQPPRDSSPWMQSQIDDARAFAESCNVHYLQRVEAAAARSGASLFAGLDAETRRAYLAIELARSGRRSVVFFGSNLPRCTADAPVDDGMLKRCRVIEVERREGTP